MTSQPTDPRDLTDPSQGADLRRGIEDAPSLRLTTSAASTDPAPECDHAMTVWADDETGWKCNDCGFVVGYPTDPAPEGGLREALRGLLDALGDPMDPKYLHAQTAGLMFQIEDLLAAHPAPETPEQVQGGGEGECRYRMHAPGDTCDCKARLAQVVTHTRTSTGGHGPDFCEECSSAVSEWMPWPCPATSDAGGALTEAECASLSEAVGRSVRPNGYVAVAVERIVAARESAAATRARAEGAAKALNDAADVAANRNFGRWLRKRAALIARSGA